LAPGEQAGAGGGVYAIKPGTPKPAEAPKTPQQIYEEERWGAAGKAAGTPQRPQAINQNSLMNAAWLYMSAYNRGKPKEQQIDINQAIAVVQQMGSQGGQGIKPQVQGAPASGRGMQPAGPSPQPAKMSYDQFRAAVRQMSPGESESDIQAAYRSGDPTTVLSRMREIITGG